MIEATGLIFTGYIPKYIINCVANPIPLSTKDLFTNPERVA